MSSRGFSPVRSGPGHLVGLHHQELLVLLSHYFKPINLDQIEPIDTRIHSEQSVESQILIFLFWFGLKILESGIMLYSRA